MGSSCRTGCTERLYVGQQTGKCMGIFLSPAGGRAHPTTWHPSATNGRLWTPNGGISSFYRTAPLPVGPERELAPAGAASPRPAPLVDELQTRVGVLLPARLGQRAAVDAHHVGGEVVLPAQQRGTHAVGVDRGGLGLEARDLLVVEAARDDDPHPLVARGVQRIAHAAGQ